MKSKTIKKKLISALPYTMCAEHQEHAHQIHATISTEQYFSHMENNIYLILVTMNA